jgi:hypothetical protein
MSLYENLPVYKKSLELAVYFDKIVTHFAKRHKYTVGSKLCNLSSEILLLVAKANTKQVRAERLQEALDKLEELKILIHLCKEIKAFRSFNGFEYSSKLVIDISKQCEGCA